MILKKIKKKILQKLWIWWINEDDGWNLRGTGKLEEIEKYLFPNMTLKQIKTGDNLLLTGNKGYIGKYLQERLQRDGIDKVDGYDACDIKEKTNLIYHLAAQTSVQKSFENPEQDLRDNVLSTINVLKYCNKIIFTSSAVVYGDRLNAKETDPTNPQSPYAISKLAAEQYIINSGIDYVILRLGNVYGRKNNKGVFKALREDGLINGNGENTRDYVYIDNVVDALISAKDWDNGIYNIGTGIATSVNTIANILGVKKNYTNAVKEQKYISLDITKAREQNFNPASLQNNYDN